MLRTMYHLILALIYVIQIPEEVVAGGNIYVSGYSCASSNYVQVNSLDITCDGGNYCDFGSSATIGAELTILQDLESSTGYVSAYLSKWNVNFLTLFESYGIDICDGIDGYVADDSTSCPEMGSYTIETTVDIPSYSGYTIGTSLSLHTILNDESGNTILNCSAYVNTSSSSYGSAMKVSISLCSVALLGVYYAKRKRVNDKIAMSKSDFEMAKNPLGISGGVVV